MNGFLQGIVHQKRSEIVSALGLTSHRELKDRCRDLPACRDFRAALLNGPDRIIAEVKRRSPSVPAFRRQEAPATLAATYEAAGAAALSLVTDRANFGTGPEDIAPMRQATSLPLIAKDFVVDSYQLLALRVAGADAVLLIARLLDEVQLAELHGQASALGMSVLVECHDTQDLNRARMVGAKLVGINNRDLDTFVVSLDVSRGLLPEVPAGCAVVVESGLHGRGEIEELQALGASAFLVGGSLLASGDPGALLRELRGEVVS